MFTWKNYMNFNKYVRTINDGGGPTGTAVWDGDVGGDAKNGVGVELIHAWGR